jgi:PAS domain S-box-containing protein
LGDWFFVSPRHSLLMTDPRDRVNAVFYIVICFSVVLFSLRARRALARERAAGLALGELAAIVESSEDAIVGKALDGKIASWNDSARELYGYTEAEMMGQPIAMLVPPERGQELAPLMERVKRGEHISHFETTRRRKDGELVEVSLSMSPIRNSDGQIVGISTIAHDIAERKKAEREREGLVSELQKAMAEVKTLSGLLPICAHCKKVRDDKGYWNQIEIYVRERSNANFTHSVCPECAKRHYPEFYKEEPQGQ